MRSFAYASKWSGHNETVRVRSNTREFKYVAARKTKRNNTVYFGAVRVSGARVNKYCAKCDAPTDATNMVVGYLNTYVHTINVNTTERQ